MYFKESKKFYRKPTTYRISSQLCLSSASLPDCGLIIIVTFYKKVYFEMTSPLNAKHSKKSNKR